MHQATENCVFSFFFKAISIYLYLIAKPHLVSFQIHCCDTYRPTHFPHLRYFPCQWAGKYHFWGSQKSVVWPTVLWLIGIILLFTWYQRGQELLCLRASCIDSVCIGFLQTTASPRYNHLHLRRWRAFNTWKPCLLTAYSSAHSHGPQHSQYWLTPSRASECFHKPAVSIRFVGSSSWMGLWQ